MFANIFTNFGENFGDLNFLLNFRQIFHHFLWKSWWFEEIGEFLITKIGDNLLTRNVTKIGEKSFPKKSENFSKSKKKL